MGGYENPSKVTYHIVAVGCSIDQRSHLPVFLRDEHIEALTEAKLSHNIIREVAKPVAHFAHNAFSITGDFLIRPVPRQLGTELPHMQEHHIFHCLQRSVREPLAEDTSFPSVQSLVNCIVGVVHSFDRSEAVIEVSFPDILAVSINIMEATVAVDRDEVRCNADMSSVFLVKCVKP